MLHMDMDEPKLSRYFYNISPKLYILHTLLVLAAYSSLFQS